MWAPDMLQCQNNMQILPNNDISVPPHLSLPHNEEVDAVACRDKAVRVQHQRLIHTSLVGLLEG
jgi:hypothetical protein